MDWRSCCSSFKYKGNEPSERLSMKHRYEMSDYG